MDVSSDIASIEKVIQETVGDPRDMGLPFPGIIIAGEVDCPERNADNVSFPCQGKPSTSAPSRERSPLREKRAEIRDLMITLSKTGDIASFYCQLRAIGKWSENILLENTRCTGKLEKRNGIWIIVQIHFFAFAPA